MTTLFDTAPLSAANLDANGFIIKTASAQNISPLYDVVVKSAVSKLSKSNLPVHSIYVYGSVAEGKARPPSSDLDMTVVLNGSATETWQPTLLKIQKEIALTHPVVSSFDLPSVSLEEVALPQSYYGWGYWFAVCCCCVHGEDLGRSFGSYRPSWRLAHGLNGDIEEVLFDYKADLTKSGADIEKLCRGAARKILRSAFCLIMTKENIPLLPLVESKKMLERYFPDQARGFDLALELAMNPIKDAAAVQQMIDSIGAWVVTEFRVAPRE